jgi:hypothetical protein
LLGAALEALPRWVLSGSLCGWGDMFMPRFELVIFLVVPRALRLARLREREQRRYGADALAPGGVMHEAHVQFIEWAAAYDAGGEDMRSRQRHERWLAGLSCRVVRCEGVLTLEEHMAHLASMLQADS